MNNKSIIQNIFNLNIIEFSKIYIENNDSNEILNIYWYPNNKIINKIVNYCKINHFKNILEIGPGNSQFELATHFVGKNEDIKDYIDLDLDIQNIPYDNKHFDFIYCRHVLEDIQNPDFLIKEMYRVSNFGYFETPSPIAELINVENNTYKGYIHHRYITWYNYKNNSIYFLPKYPIIEYISFDKEYELKLYKLLNNYCVYWNSYVLWNENNKPNIIMLKNGVNFNIRSEYVMLLKKSIEESIQSTNYFINNIINI